MPTACGYVLPGIAFCPHARGDDSFDTAFAALELVIETVSPQNRVDPAGMPQAYA
jgi:hypothetical protein